MRLIFSLETRHKLTQVQGTLATESVMSQSMQLEHKDEVDRLIAQHDEEKRKLYS